MRLVSILLFTFFGLNSLAANPIHLPDIIVNGTVMVGSTASPNSKSILDLESTTTGFLPPRMTTTQRNAITSPPLGLAIQNSTTTYPDYYDGSQWQGILSIPSRSTSTGILHIATGTVTASSVSLTQDVSGTLPIASGGTGLTSNVLGDVIFSSSANTLSTLAGNTSSTKKFFSQTGTGAVSAAPIWLQPAFSDLSGQASLTTQVSGTLPVGSGGTGIASGTSGGILGFTASGTIASSGALTVSQLIKGGGAGATPSTFTACSDGQIIKYASGIPACGADSTGGGTLTYRGVTSTDSTTTSDNINVLSGASFTEQIYTASGNAGAVLQLSHNGTSFSQIYTLTNTSSESINGPGGAVASGSYKLTTNGESVRMISTGTQWQLLEHKTINEWESTTNSFSSSGTALAKGTTQTDKFWYRRVGQNLEFRVEYSQNGAGTNGTGEFFIQLGSTGLSIDSTKVQFNTAAGTSVSFIAQSVVGHCDAIAGTTSDNGYIFPYDATRMRVMKNSRAIAAANVDPFTLGSTNMLLMCTGSVPISGWQP